MVSFWGLEMRILVDGYELGPQGKGVGRVAKNILPLLATQLEDIYQEEVRLFVLTREVVLPFHRRSLQQVILPSRGGYFRWQNGPFWRTCRRLDPDLILAFNYTLPVICPWPSLLFVHDLSLLTHPEWFPRRTARWRGWLLRRSIRKASRIVVPSLATAAEITSSLKVKKEKMEIIFYGVEDKFKPAEEEAVRSWKEERGLTGRRLIGFLGAIFRRRNLPLLVSAVASLRQEWPDVFLYVVGQDRTYPPQNLASLLQQEWIRWDEFLPEVELGLFYSACDLFVYLSEYEGFGFPPLEALACGSLPVVLRRSSLQEIFHGLAIMVDEASVESVIQALRLGLTDEARRREIRQNFCLRREEFSWQRASQKLAQLIAELKT